MDTWDPDAAQGARARKLYASMGTTVNLTQANLAELFLSPATMKVDWQQTSIQTDLAFLP